MYKLFFAIVNCVFDFAKWVEWGPDNVPAGNSPTTISNARSGPVVFYGSQRASMLFGYDHISTGRSRIPPEPYPVRPRESSPGQLP